MKHYEVELEVTYVYAVRAADESDAIDRAKVMLADREAPLEHVVASAVAEPLEPGQVITKPSVKKERDGLPLMPLNIEGPIDHSRDV